MTEVIPAAKPIIGDEEREAVDRVLRSGMIAGGPEVAAFESVGKWPADGSASQSTRARQVPIWGC